MYDTILVIEDEFPECVEFVESSTSDVLFEDACSDSVSDEAWIDRPERRAGEVYDSLESIEQTTFDRHEYL